MPGGRLSIVFAVAVCSCVTEIQEPQATRSPTPTSIQGQLEVETVAEGLEHPWSLAFLPDGRMLVTERPGRLRIITTNGHLSEPLTGVPQVYAHGQGGLLDVKLDPQFTDNHRVYLSYAEPGEKDTAGTAVARGRLVDNSLEELQVIYQQKPKVQSEAHFGSRLVFARDGSLLITQGDRGFRDNAQDLSVGLGKIVRIQSDGTVPNDNPFVKRKQTESKIWSYGHRNIQAAGIHPDTGQLWTVEHGAQGGDELNHPQAGKNYGWPVITYGVDYGGATIGQTAKAGMEQPVYYWDPVIAPSGMVFYTGKAFPEWKGSLFIGSLKPGLLVRLTLKDDHVTHEERYLAELHERIREVEQGPDDLLYVLTDNDHGRILRLSPKKK